MLKICIEGQVQESGSNLGKCDFCVNYRLEKCKKVGGFVLGKCILLGFCACILAK